MMSSILTHVLQLLSIFILLQLQCIGTEAYPITSKPIEWTAENWAWQSWAKQTSEEQSKGKGRKVTPKSIFETPYRNGCPPGHHADGNRCIPTVSIDPNDLISKQVLAIVGSTSFEFDYGDEFGSAISDGLGYEAMYNTYDEPQKFSGGSLPLPTSFDNAGQLPSQDAPLKFNFFEQKLSTNENDTIADNMSYDEEYGIPVRPNNVITSTLKNNTEVFVDDSLRLFWKNNETIYKNVTNTPMANISALNTDLIKESKNTSTSNASSNTASVVTLELPTASKDFPIVEIDAISLSSAVPMRHLTGATMQEDIEKNTPATHKISLPKGDSVVQLITTDGLLSEHETQSINQDKELSQLISSDGILALFDGTGPSSESESESASASSSSSSVSSTENVRPSSEITFTKSTNYENEKATTTIGFPQKQIHLGNKEDSWKQKEKSDHTRSVTETFLMSADDLSAQESEFTTTLEPDETTSFQLDDTTIIEALNPPTIELQELHVKPAYRIKLEEHQLHDNNIIGILKSKVQPVSDTTTEASSALPLPIAAPPDSQQFDSDIIIDGDFNIGDSVVNVIENQFNYGGGTTTTATTTTSTLDNADGMHTEPEAESNIFYDLVKGANNNENNKNEQETTENGAFIETEITKTDAEIETTSSTNNDAELSNIEMETSTISSDHKLNNNNNSVNENSKAQHTLVTRTDVNDNNNEPNKNYNDDVGEIVFVIASHNSNNKTRQPSDNNISTTKVESGDESYANENVETASSIKVSERTIITTIPTTTTTTERITSKRWSKVMPIFDQKTNPSTTEQLVDETTFKIHEIIMAEREKATMAEKSIKQSATAITSEFLLTTTITPITEIVSSSSISEKRSKTGSRRNSKIIRSDKYPLAASVNRLSESSKFILPPSPISASQLSSSSSLSSASEAPIISTTVSTTDGEIIDRDSSYSSSINLSNSDRSDPFWWLPMGWHLDRHENFEGRPLLLRLWTTFTSNNQAKV